MLSDDVASIQALLENLTRETQNQLQLQGRTIVENAYFNATTISLDAGARMSAR